MIILIPCKSLSAGKSRLSRCLDGPHRRTLCGFFLKRMIELATTVAGAGHVRVVTSDPAAVTLAGRQGISFFPDAGDGLNAALETARNRLLAAGLLQGRLTILPIDLPYATADAVAEAGRSDADVIINSDERGRGTNLLILSASAGRIPFSFGADSFSAHTNTARKLGFEPHIVHDWRVAHDIDDPDQYLAWTQSAAFPHHLLTADGTEPHGGTTAPL